MKLATSTQFVIGCATLLSTFSTAVAQEDADWKTWGDMREQVVSADEMLAADVSNGINPVGTVTDLVLSADGSRVEYVMLEVPYPYAVYGGENGFVGFDRVDFQHRGLGLDMDVVIDRDEPVSAPDELRLTGAEADNRLVSRLLAEPMRFSSEESREITDILIDRESGMITHWVVEMAEDALFSTDRRAIPADEISVEEGAPSTRIEVATLDDLQEYDSRFL